MRFSPRIHDLLVEQVGSFDDGRGAIAEVWRQVGREADRVGLTRPGYHSVRILVLAERERRAARNEELLHALAEVTSRVPDLLRVLDHLGGAYRHHRSTLQGSIDHRLAGE